MIEGSPSSLGAVTAAAITALGERIERLADGAVPFDGEVLDAALAHLDGEGCDLADADTETLVAVASVANGQFGAAGSIGDVLLDRLAADPLPVTEALVSIADGDPTTLLERADRSRVEAKLEAAGPEKPLPGEH